MTLEKVIREALAQFRPPPNVGTTEWADRFRYLSPKASALPGKYSTRLTPYMPGIHDALDDPKVWKVVCQKAAQVAWTDGAVNNYIGRRIDVDPCPIVAMFPKEGAAKEYNEEKFTPMVEVTPRLADKVDISKSRAADNRQLFKNFAGGFLKLVGANSPSSVKSTPAPVVIVEEPDDCSLNVKGQGDSIKLLEERTKTYHRRKVIFGGTPSVKGLSHIAAEYDSSDRRKFWVPCHECGEHHVLSWDNLHWMDGAEQPHEVYGLARPETAMYRCPHCSVLWNDNQKNANVRRGEWRAERPSRGIAGFYLNELYSPFPGSRLARLVERYLEAKHHEEMGDEREMIVFVNSCLGLPYEQASTLPDADDLAERGLDYQENTVPQGGLILTAGVDVQHDRLAIIIRAWGREEESWLVFWGEIYGNCIDKNDPVWETLDSILFRAYEHETGAALGVSAASIDSSDGQTSDAVYHYVRARQRRGVMAIKGASLNSTDREIFSVPRDSVDRTSRKSTKADKYGLRPYIVGTHRAKDLISARLDLEGIGAGRMHWYQTVRGDYYRQITAEVLAPSRQNPRKKTWQKKVNERNEALDCEVYALHASRRLKVHLLRGDQWDDVEKRVLQADLFTNTTTAPPLPQKKRRVRSRGLEN